MNRILNIEREKTFDLYFGREYIKTLTLDYFEPITKASALLSINRFLEDEGMELIPFTRLNIFKTHLKRVA